MLLGRPFRDGGGGGDGGGGTGDASGGYAAADGVGMSGFGTTGNFGGDVAGADSGGDSAGWGGVAAANSGASDGGGGGDGGGVFGSSTDAVEEAVKSNWPRYMWALTPFSDLQYTQPVHISRYADYRTVSPLSISNYGRGIMGLDSAPPVSLPEYIPALAPAPVRPSTVGYNPLFSPANLSDAQENKDRFFSRFNRGLRSLVKND